jgi:hypothetical protein
VKQELATGPRVMATNLRANILSALVPRTPMGAGAEASCKKAEAWSKGEERQPSKATSSSGSQSSSSASAAAGAGADLKSEVAPHISSPHAACLRRSIRMPRA